jgi:hypothetical protein
LINLIGSAKLKNAFIFVLMFVIELSQNGKIRFLLGFLPEIWSKLVI